jgi:hypothetical protein
MAGGSEPAPFKKFERFADWLDAIEELGLAAEVPDVVADKYVLALKHCLIAWIDLQFLRAAEWAAFGALEYALNDRYGRLIHDLDQAAAGRPLKFRPKGSSKCLEFMLGHDGLTDDVFRFSLKYRIPATQQLRRDGAIRPTLYQRRNELMHGRSSDAYPASGIIEMIRDLIDHAYRSPLHVFPTQP